MAIRMEYDHTLESSLGTGGYVPRVACDSCGQLIDDPIEGLVLWVVTDVVDVAIQPVFHVHRGACDDRLRKKLEAGTGHTYWEGLLEHTLHVVENIAPAGRGPNGVRLVELTPAHPLHDR
jgi:hypothetical protein